MINRQEPALRRCTRELFSFSDGVHYLHFAGWDGPRHTEKVSASSTPVFLIHRVCFRGITACVLCAKVQSRGPGIVCEQCPRVDHHRGVGVALVFVPADGAQRPLHL